MSDYYSEQQILAALQELRPALPTLLPPDQARELEARLDKILQKPTFAGSKPVIAVRAMEAVSDYPEAQEALKILLERAAGEGESTRFMGDFQPAPGGPLPLPPGTKLVCPVSPSHYSRRLRVAGQRLYCPQHQVELVPESPAGG